jgi:hypothetical protein
MDKSTTAVLSNVVYRSSKNPNSSYHSSLRRSEYLVPVLSIKAQKYCKGIQEMDIYNLHKNIWRRMFLHNIKISNAGLHVDLTKLT